TPITPTPVRRRLPARTRGRAQRRKARSIVPRASPSRTCRLKSTRPGLPPLGPHLGETALALVVGLARRLHEAPLVPVGIARAEHRHAVGLVLGFLGVTPAAFTCSYWASTSSTQIRRSCSGPRPFSSQ